MDLFLAGVLAQGEPNFLKDLLIMVGMMFLIMWLLVIRPQRKEQKQRMEMLQNLKKGDSVVTNGGIVGKITRIKEDRIELKVDESNNTKINFLRSAVINIIPKEQKEKKK